MANGDTADSVYPQWMIDEGFVDQSGLQTTEGPQMSLQDQPYQTSAPLADLQPTPPASINAAEQDRRRRMALALAAKAQDPGTIRSAGARPMRNTLLGDLGESAARGVSRLMGDKGPLGDRTVAEYNAPGNVSTAERQEMGQYGPMSAVEKHLGWGPDVTSAGDINPLEVAKRAGGAGALAYGLGAAGPANLARYEGFHPAAHKIPTMASEYSILNPMRGATTPYTTGAPALADLAASPLSLMQHSKLPYQAFLAKSAADATQGSVSPALQERLRRMSRPGMTPAAYSSIKEF